MQVAIRKRKEQRDKRRNLVREIGREQQLAGRRGEDEALPLALPRLCSAAAAACPPSAPPPPLPGLCSAGAASVARGRGTRERNRYEEIETTISGWQGADALQPFSGQPESP